MRFHLGWGSLWRNGVHHDPILRHKSLAYAKDWGQLSTFTLLCCVHVRTDCVDFRIVPIEAEDITHHGTQHHSHRDGSYVAPMFSDDSKACDHVAVHKSDRSRHLAAVPDRAHLDTSLHKFGLFPYVDHSRSLLYWGDVAHVYRGSICENIACRNAAGFRGLRRSSTFHSIRYAFHYEKQAASSRARRRKTFAHELSRREWYWGCPMRKDDSEIEKWSLLRCVLCLLDNAVKNLGFRTL